MSQAHRSPGPLPEQLAQGVEPHSFSHTMPAPPTPLIGRAREIATLVATLRRSEVRLLTLLGPPGIGKTRLVLQVAADLRSDFTDGVYFVSLVPIVDPILVVPTIAKAVGVKETGGHHLLQSLQSYLRTKRALLVLDNFEHVVEAAPLLSELLAAAPLVTILVTSREILRLSSEHTFTVPFLSLPPVLAPQGPPRMLAPLPADQLAGYESVQLFLQRAQALKPDFDLTDETASTVAEICRRLDGLPLAIELAAARIRHLSAQAILERLQDRLSLLTGGARDVPARHQTLRAAIEWSHSLLNEPEQKLFRRLAVFRGGRTLAAIEAVCNAAGDLEVEVLDGVSSLLDKNLLKQRERAGEEPRYVMLETIYAYAREKLEESQEAEILYQQQATYFTRLAERAEPELKGPQQVDWLDRLEVELDNLRAALEWTCPHDIRLGLRLAAALGTFWNRRGYWSEGLARMLEMLSSARAAGVDRTEAAAAMAGVLYAAGFLSAMRGGDFVSARPLLAESVAIFKLVQNREARRGLPESLNLLGIVMGRLDGMTARRALHEEALAAAGELGDAWSAARSLYQLGHVGRLSGDDALGQSMFEQSLTLFRGLGDKFNIGLALIGVGQMAERRADYEEARRAYEECLTIFRELGDKWGTSGALYSLGSTALGRQDYAGARSILEESLAVAKELGSQGQVADVLQLLGRVAYFFGDYPGAHALYLESLGLYRESADQYGSTLCLADLAGVILVANRATTRAAVRRSKGQAKDEGAAQEVATRAVQALGAAQALFDSIGVQLDPLGQELFNSYTAAAGAQLDRQTCAAAWAAGRALNLEQAVAWMQSTPFPEPAQTEPQSSAAPRAGKGVGDGLTRREREVAMLIAEGKSNRDIADMLVVGERTVEGHVSNILAKLSFRSRAQISAWVIQQGLSGQRT